MILTPDNDPYFYQTLLAKRPIIPGKPNCYLVRAGQVVPEIVHDPKEVIEYIEGGEWEASGRYYDEDLLDEE